ncbi:hypothetical protein ACFLY4_02580 [Chloroflexota bacterium]
MLTILPIFRKVSLGRYPLVNFFEDMLHQSCPRGAFRSESFERPLCKLENDQREADAEILAGSIMGIEEPSEDIKPCRFCELACPVAQGAYL